MIISRSAIVALVFVISTVSQAAPVSAPPAAKPYNPALRNSSPINGSAAPGQTHLPFNSQPASGAAPASGHAYHARHDEQAKLRALHAREMESRKDRGK